MGHKMCPDLRPSQNNRFCCTGKKKKKKEEMQGGKSMLDTGFTGSA